MDIPTGDRRKIGFQILPVQRGKIPALCLNRYSIVRVGSMRKSVSWAGQERAISTRQTETSLLNAIASSLVNVEVPTPPLAEISDTTAWLIYFSEFIKLPF